MTLDISTSLTQTGTSGSAGAFGTAGTVAARDGGDGGDGTTGQSASFDFSNQAFIGDAGGDRIGVSRTATGGNGGNGGGGGTGAPALATSVNSSGPGFSRVDTTWDTAGDGGRGGAGGNGGTGRVAFDTLVFDLGGGTAQNAVTLTGSASGGRGGSGGAGGGGGSSGSTSTVTSTTVSGGASFASITNTEGSAAGLSPDGRNGRDGRNGTVDFSDITVTGDNVRMSLTGTAQGGSGGSGGAGQSGRIGSVGSDGGDGGDGGSGGRGTATVERLNLDVTGGLNLLVNLQGRGGTGATGGGTGAAGWGNIGSGNSVNGVGGFVGTTTYAAAGNGGDGGNGGAGTARLQDCVIQGSGAVDLVEILLRGTGGAGIAGTAGAPGVADNTVTAGTSYVQTFITIGTAAGVAGGTGTAGQGLAEMTGNTIRLGGGDDALTLRFTADGPGARVVTVSGNTFDGGSGTDRITIGAQTATDKAVEFDVAGDRVRVDGGAWNGMTGFETIAGGSANDRFLDGKNSQSYRGNLGADRFEFRGGQAGADTVTGFVGDDVIRLRGFGSGLDSFAEVLAAATDTANGVLIVTGAGSSVLLAGVLEAALVADDFAF